MAETNDSAGDQPAWKGEQAPCVYCGQVIERTSDRCPHCRTSFSFAVRQASREVVGDWYYLDSRNPSGRGVTFETLIKMIEKGRIKADSVVRGPITHHDWMYAAETPRLAKYLGMCPHCFAEAKPEETFCTSCQLNMNARPADPRPGIPPDLVKEPYHAAAYEMEKKLAGSAAATEAPPPAPAPTPPPRPAAAPTPRPEPTPTATAAAAAAALADTGTAVADRKSRVVASAARQGRPKLWLVLVLTWVTLIPIVLLAYFFIPPINRAVKSMFGGGTTQTRPPDSNSPKPDEKWLQEQLAAADRAEQAKDYARAISILKAVLAQTGDTSLQVRIEALQRKPAEERKARRDELGKRLVMARQFAADHQYDDALAILRNISKEDRSFLASPDIALDVDAMETTFRTAQAAYVKQQKQQQQLTGMLAQAADLRKAKQFAEALSLYTQIGNTFPEALVKKHIDLGATIQQVQGAIAAAAPTPPPSPPPPPPDEAAKVVADLLAAAAGLEKQEKFAEALAKLEEIKTTVDEKFWPDALENRIKQVKAKKEALEFFGIDAPKK